MATIIEIGDALAAAVKAAAPGVVRVHAPHRRPGTGFAWSPDGLIVTSARRLDRGDAVGVTVDGGDEREGEVVGRDPGTDVAVIRVPGPLAPLPFRGADTVEVGHLALALGRPGRSVRASLRIVGVVGADEVRTPGGGRLDRYVETDRAIPRGFAGGPLIDGAGRAIGMNSRAAIPGADLAVPQATIARVVEHLLAHGSVQRGYLGVAAYPAKLPRPIADQLSQRRGALVVAVEDDGPAAAAGLVLGDVLVGLAGQPVHGPGDLRALLADRAGQDVALRVLRAGVVVDVTARVGARG